MFQGNFIVEMIFNFSIFEKRIKKMDYNYQEHILFKSASDDSK